MKSLCNHLWEFRLSFFVAILAVFFHLYNVNNYMHWRETTLNYPPVEVRYDDVDYDNLAFTLAKKSTFSFDWDNEEWRSRYYAFNDDGYFNGVFERYGSALTTFRPPLFPFVVSIGYRVFTPSFAVGRIINISLMSAAIFIAVFSAGFFGGAFSSFFVALLIFIRPHIEAFSNMYLTESLATFLLTTTFLLSFSLIQGQKSRSFKRQCITSAFTGLSFALLTLTRSVFALWTPFIACLFFLHFLRYRNTTACKLFAIASMTFLLTAGTWWIRNSILTKTFAPLGSQGMMGIAGAYSDHSYYMKGLWSSESFLKAYHEAELSPLVTSTKTAPEREIQIGRLMSTTAYSWIKDNAEKIPSMAYWRLKHHFTGTLHVSRKPHVPLISFTLFIALVIGLFGWLRKEGGYLFLTVFIIDSLVVGLTYPDHSRFLTPLIPVYALATLGIFFILNDARFQYRNKSSN